MESCRLLYCNSKLLILLQRGLSGRISHRTSSISTNGITDIMAHAAQRQSDTVKKVFVSRNLPHKALDLLRSSRHSIDVWNESNKPIPRKELMERVKNCNGIICLLTEKINKELLDAAGPSLEVVSTMSVGYDHIDLSAIKERKVQLGNTPDVLTDATAELTVALLLMTARRLLEAAQEAKSGGWGTWSPSWMCGTSLKGKTIGIVGMGRIGKAIAKILASFKIKNILYSGTSPKNIDDVGVDCQFVSFDELLTHSDVVCACCSLNENTVGLFHMEAFKKMKKDAIFINSSRGGIVNQEDLTTALADGIIGAAGLDVTTPEPLPIDNKLFQLRNCVIIPHVGSAELQTREDMATLAVRNLLSALDGSEMPSEVK